MRELGFEVVCLSILLIFLGALIPSVRQSVLSIGTLLNTSALVALAVSAAVLILNYLKKRKRTAAPRMISLSLATSKRMEMVRSSSN